MDFTTTIDVSEVFAQGARVGHLRRSLHWAANELFARTSKELERRRKGLAKGMSEGGAARRKAWRDVVTLTSSLAKSHDVLTQVLSLEKRADGLFDDVVLCATHLVELARLDLPEALLPPDMKELLDQVRDGESDPKRLAGVVLGIGWSAEATVMAEVLEPLTEFHLSALHASVLVDLVDATPAADAASEADLAAFGDDVTARTRAVRDAARTAAERLMSGSASPALASGLWAALYRFEDWLMSSGTSGLAAICSAATARVASGSADAERWAREAGQAYDGIRQGLAYDAGVRTVLLACAVQDERALSAFAATASLPLGTRTPDHPRTPLSSVASAAEGSAIEIAGLVTAASFRVGGPSHRSVLTLGGPDGVQVLVPHVAVDSFGVGTGVWTQVRGTAYPDGKDGLDGPLVMAGRIRWAEAAEQSFTDALVFAGRQLVELRPGGIDIVAGRVAGDVLTLSEIGLRR